MQPYIPPTERQALEMRRLGMKNAVLFIETLVSQRIVQR
jgi:hypothetical protein